MRSIFLMESNSQFQQEKVNLYLDVFLRAFPLHILFFPFFHGVTIIYKVLELIIFYESILSNLVLLFTDFCDQ